MIHLLCVRLPALCYKKSIAYPPLIFHGFSALSFSENRRKKGAVAAELSEKDAELFESLRELRREIASEEKVPPYMVFADKTLAGMCVMRPATRDEMLEVSGVGEHKLEKYGDRFLEILRKG